MTFDDNFPSLKNKYYATIPENTKYWFSNIEIQSSCLDKVRVREAIEKARIGTVYQKCHICNKIINSQDDCVNRKSLLKELGIAEK